MVDIQRADEQVLSSIKKTCRRLDLGKTTIFRLINEGRLDVVKIGGRTLITERSIQKLASPIAAEFAV